MNLFMYAAIICFIISALLSGGFTTGYQQRGNYYSESKQDRAWKRKAAGWLLVGGAIFFAAGAISYRV